jgi:phenylacetate-CoA ligase
LRPREGAPQEATAISTSAAYCYENSGFYRDKLDELGAAPADIRSLRDLAQLPVLLDKETERELMLASTESAGHPYGEHLCAPLDKVVGVCSTSGTTGDPTFYPFTASDIQVQDALWAKGFTEHGVRAGDTVMHAFGLSMFLAGYPVVRALEHMGARPIPVGAEAGSEKLARFVRLTKPVAICLTPSYAEYLIEQYDVASWGIRKVFCAGEPGAGLPELRVRLEDGFGGATVVDMMGGGKGIMCVSCRANQGMHALGTEHWIQQIVDPQSREPLEWGDGNIGLRVLTTLSWEAAPWLRATPGDVCEVFDSPCACGLSSPRYRVVGRADDMLIVKGVKIYPAAIRNLLSEYLPRVSGHFRIDLSEPGPRVHPPLRLRVELANVDDTDIAAEIVRRMHGKFGITPSIEPVPVETLERGKHKQQLIEIRPA